jgi:hypothetical protein
MKALYPDDARLADFDEESRVVVSEPLGDLPACGTPFRTRPGASCNPGRTN